MDKKKRIEGMLKEYGPRTFPDGNGGFKTKTKYRKEALGKPFLITRSLVFQTNHNGTEEVFEYWTVGMTGHDSLEEAVVHWIKLSMELGILESKLK